MNKFILRSKAVLFLALTIGLFACQDVIEFEVNRSGSQLVVDGTIVPGQSPQFLNLGFTSVKEQIPIPINFAEVTLFDENGNSEAYEPALAEVDPNLPPNPDRPVIDGKYQFNADIITPEPGGTYFIEIVLPGGKTYRSLPETIPDVTIQDSLYTEFIEIEQLNDEYTGLQKPASPVWAVYLCLVTSLTFRILKAFFYSTEPKTAAGRHKIKWQALLLLMILLMMCIFLT